MNRLKRRLNYTAKRTAIVSDCANSLKAELQQKAAWTWRLRCDTFPPLTSSFSRSHLILRRSETTDACWRRRNRRPTTRLGSCARPDLARRHHHQRAGDPRADAAGAVGSDAVGQYR